MMPLIHAHYSVFVDTSQNHHLKLGGPISVVIHKKQGLIVSWLQPFDGTEVLVPENREYNTVPDFQPRLADGGADPVVDRGKRSGPLTASAERRKAKISAAATYSMPACTT
jgi:hypothetical protein